MADKASRIFQLYIVSIGILFLGVIWLSPLHTRAAADTTPPRITGLTIDKTVAHVGDTVTVTVSLEEEDSGVSVCGVSMLNPETEEMISTGCADGIWEAYTGEAQFTMDITKDMVPGTYHFSEAEISDHARNLNRYASYGNGMMGNIFNEGEFFTISPEYYQLTIINDEYKAASFEMKSIEIKNHSIKTGDKLPVDVLLEGDIPDNFFVNLFIEPKPDPENPETIMNNTYPHAILWSIDKDTCPHEGGLYHLELDAIEDLPGSIGEWLDGNYRIRQIMTGPSEDMSNPRNYQLVAEDESDQILIDKRDKARCNILGENLITYTETDTGKDRTPPEIISVKLHTNTVTRPGLLEVDVSARDDVCLGDVGLYAYKDGVDMIGGGCEIYKNSTITTWTGTAKMYVPKYVQAGKCELVVQVRDKAGNRSRNYYTEIEVVDEFDIAFDIGSDHPNLISKINSLKPSETGLIRVKTVGTVIAKKEIFEAIKGKDVNIVFYTESYDWIFNGKDIVNPKDIKIGLSYYIDSPGDGRQFLCLVFPNNGQLPGPAQIRVESYALEEIWDKENALVLYYLQENGELEELSNTVEYIDGGSEHWCYFTISHNSTYCVGGKRLKLKIKSIKLSGLSHNILQGKKIQLKAILTPSYAKNKKLKWTSSNKKVATVTQKGKVTIKKNTAGKKVTITAKAKDGSGRKATWKITVMKGAVKKITVKGHKKTMKAGKTMQLLATVKATKGKPVNKRLKWISSNTKYAGVTQFGLVEAKKAGKGRTVTITAMSSDGTNIKVKKKIKIK